MVARARFWIVIAACSPLVALGVACGLDESGLQSNDASTGGDGGGNKDVVAYDALNDVPLPPSCATDTSCLGLDAGIPDGWAPYVGSFDGGACPSGDFTGTQWVTNSQLTPGSCSCTCSTGTSACPSTAAIALGFNSCFNNASPTTEQCQGNGGGHIQLVDAGASATCDIDASGPTVQTDPVTLCSIGCDAGASAFCSQPQGTRCIVADGVQTCPGGLTGYVIGASANPWCAPCSCQVSGAACTATATLYKGYYQGGYHADSNCDDGGQNTVTTLALNGTCQNVTNGFDSYSVTLTPSSSPSCTVPSNAGTGDAGLASPKTVCCN